MDDFIRPWGNRTKLGVVEIMNNTGESPKNKKWWWTAVVWKAGVAFFIVVGGGFFFLVGTEKASLYNGKTVQEWVERLDRNKPVQHDEAAKALVEIGPSAVSDLKRILSQRQGLLTEIRTGIIQFASRCNLTRAPSVDREQLQGRACEAAYLIAERASSDISCLTPYLYYHLTNGTYADISSARALARSGNRGVSILTNLLFSPKPGVRNNAGMGLSFAKTNGAAINALLQSARSDPDLTLRANALLYLRGGGASSKDMVVTAIQLIDSKNDFARHTAELILADYPDDETVREVRANRKKMP